MASIGPTTSTRRLLETQEAIRKTLEKLSSGRRINAAADDAANLAISEKLRALERGFQQGVRNLNDGISVARTAEGALSETSNLASRMRELTIQAGNGALGDAERAAIQTEFDALSEEITRISESTTFNGRNLLNGDTSGTDAITLRDGSGGNDVVQISIEDKGAAALGLEGLDVSNAYTLTAIDLALERISASRADLGAVESRLGIGCRAVRQSKWIDDAEVLLEVRISQPDQRVDCPRIGSPAADAIIKVGELKVDVVGGAGRLRSDAGSTRSRKDHQRIDHVRASDRD